MKKLNKKVMQLPSSIEAYGCLCGISCSCDVNCSCFLGLLADSNHMGIVNVGEDNNLSDRTASNYRK